VNGAPVGATRWASGDWRRKSWGAGWAGYRGESLLRACEGPVGGEAPLGGKSNEGRTSRQLD